MIAKEGRIILIPLLLITFPIGIYAHASNNNILIILYSILGLLFLFSLNFFRDPVRVVPNDKGTVISPADGKIVKITEVDDSDVGESAILVSIFLYVFFLFNHVVCLTFGNLGSMKSENPIIMMDP